ncbi:hypothetical protein BC628DRAFT_1152924 [Trametes gibbosa]|nr:hypothetical protein BC628DRAFT_1152924 [Trametes gibbosa]
MQQTAPRSAAATCLVPPPHAALRVSGSAIFELYHISIMTANPAPSNKLPDPLLVIPPFEEESVFRLEDAGDALFSPEGKRPVFRSTCFWASDGNVVVVADHTAAFRVHRGVLARHSSVFRDMFGLPQRSPPAGADDERLDGCPVVHVSESPADFALLLKVLYDGVHVLRYGQCLPFRIVAVALELGRKYDIEHLRADALSRLETCLCDSLYALWANARFYQVTIPGPEGDEQQWALTSAAMQIVPVWDAIRAVNLVRAVDELSMLPMAMYLCTLLPVPILLYGTTRSYGGGNGRVDTLARDDVIRCVGAHPRLAVRRDREHSDVLAVWSPHLVKDATHSHERTVCSSRYGRRTESQHVLTYLADTVFQGKGFCAVCERNMLARDHDGKRSSWAELPEELGLNASPSWDATLPVYRWPKALTIDITGGLALCDSLLH